MNRNTIGLIFAGLITGAAFAVIALRAPQSNSLPESAGQPITVTGKATVGGPFALTDHNGKHVTEKDFLGRYMLVFFGFTNCPDICPAGLQVMSAALDKLGSRADQVTPVFISFDTVQDTPAKLATYIKSFHPRLVGLTGSEADIASVAKGYRVFYQKVPDEKNPEHYTFDHSAIFYLMGKDGVLVAPIPYTTDVDQIVQSLDAALPK